MILQMVCSENELDKVKEAFPNAQVIVTVENTKLLSSNKRVHDIKTARLEIIKNVLRTKQKTYNTGVLYNLIRREGYPVSYKTFQRDMTLLHSFGDVKKETTIGGVNGTTTLWRIK